MKVELEKFEPRFLHLRIVDPVVQTRLATSFEDYGQLVPVLAVETLLAPRLVLIDGYRRLAAAEELGWSRLDALVLPLDEREALLLHRHMKRTRESALEDGWYLHELLEGQGMSQHELAVQFHCSASWISRRLALVRDLPEEVQQAVRDGRLTPDAAMKSLVPLSRDNPEAARQIVAAWRGRIRGADLRTVCLGWLQAADDAARQAIQRDPVTFAALETELAQSPACGELAEGVGADPVLRDLHALAGICHRARKRLATEESPQRASGGTVGLWRQALATAWVDLGRALARLEEGLTRAGALHAAGP